MLFSQGFHFWDVYITVMILILCCPRFMQPVSILRLICSVHVSRCICIFQLAMKWYITVTILKKILCINVMNLTVSLSLNNTKFMNFLSSLELLGILLTMCALGKLTDKMYNTPVKRTLPPYVFHKHRNSLGVSFCERCCCQWLNDRSRKQW